MAEESGGDDTKNDKLPPIEKPEAYDPDKDIDYECDTSGLDDLISDPFTPIESADKIVNLDMTIDEHLVELEGLIKHVKTLGIDQNVICVDTERKLRTLDWAIAVVKAQHPDDKLEWRVTKLHSLMNILADFRENFPEESDDESASTDTKRRRF